MCKTEATFPSLDLGYLVLYLTKANSLVMQWAAVKTHLGEIMDPEHFNSQDMSKRAHTAGKPLRGTGWPPNTRRDGTPFSILTN